MRDLHELPKLRDGLSYLYLERCRVEQKYKAVEAVDVRGRTMIPAAALAVLMLGPGTTITHAAIKALADNGCSVVWTGEEGTRVYAQGKRAAPTTCCTRRRWPAIRYDAWRSCCACTATVSARRWMRA
jgi:CRISPR/Cas system-associated endonuclease Cas1